MARSNSAATAAKTAGVAQLVWLAGLAAGACVGAGSAALADEGMWLVNQPPMKILAERHNFEPDAAWLKKAMTAAVRYGASGSFVSSEGLVLTNHHVVVDDLVRLSSAERDLVRDGYTAKTRADELPISGAQLTVLDSIEDVTKVVEGAVAKGASAADAGRQRREMIATIEQREAKATGLECRVVTLWGGGAYHLYRSKRFTDVRLVWAPEKQLGFFGGDCDNFEYPRFALDAALVRVYENGKPYRPTAHLTVSTQGIKEGDLAIVLGHPGRTERLLTVDHLKFRRDVTLPFRLGTLWRAEVKGAEFASRSAENARVVSDELFGAANSRKALTGQLAGLLDPALMARKKAEETQLVAGVAEDAGLKVRAGDAWKKLSSALEAYRPWQVRHAVVTGAARWSLLGPAVEIVRLSEEQTKPNAQRMQGYGEADLPGLMTRLYAEEPFNADHERFKLESALSLLAERLGGDDPLVTALLQGRSPAARAREVIAGTKLHEATARKALAESGRDGVLRSSDPIIPMAIALEQADRELTRRYLDEVESVERDAYGRLAAARFAVLGKEVYPDATGTLRLSFGPVRAITGSSQGKAAGNGGGPASGAAKPGEDEAPAFTMLSGLFARSRDRAGHPDFDLPRRWREAESKLDLSTPFNFICTADIIGGNSGSPVLNREGDVVGLIFDGNLGSLSWAFAYGDDVGRAVAVDARAIITALREVYGAAHLADEMTAKAKPAAEPEK